MIPDGFGDPVPSFENAHGQTGRDTPYLTHTPSSSFGGSPSCRPALAFASHCVSTFTTHFGTIEGKPLFYTFFLFTQNGVLVHGLGPVHGHGRGPVLGVVVWVDLD